MDMNYLNHMLNSSNNDALLIVNWNLQGTGVKIRKLVKLVIILLQYRND